MPPPKAAEAYQDCEEHFARALAAPRGIAITVSESGRAIQLMQKLNHYRERLRKESKKVYPSDHPQHNSSIYDKLQVTKDSENPCRVLIKPYVIAVESVEEL